MNALSISQPPGGLAWSDCGAMPQSPAMTIILVLIALLGGCGQSPERPAANQAAETPPIAPAQPPAAKGFAFDEKSDLLEFSYSWPAEAAAIAKLDRRFRAEMDKARGEAISSAESEREVRAKMKAEWFGHQFSRTWSMAGQSERLLSLESATHAFTGGAHSNYGSGALLWDRQAEREITPADVLTRAQRLAALIREPFCSALDRERLKRRGEPTDPTDMFGACPRLDELTIVPTDKDGDKRFDTVRLIADPYVAGPWSEGDYVIELPISETILTALRPEFRASFEVQPQ